MRRRYYAIASLASALILEGCSDSLPTANLNAPPPSGQPAPVAQGVIQPKKKSGGKFGPAQAPKPAPTTPNAL